MLSTILTGLLSTKMIRTFRSLTRISSLSQTCFLHPKNTFKKHIKCNFKTFFLSYQHNPLLRAPFDHLSTLRIKDVHGIPPMFLLCYSLKLLTARAWSAVFYLCANPHENDNPKISAPPIRTAARKAAAAHSLIPALVTRLLQNFTSTRFLSISFPIAP